MTQRLSLHTLPEALARVDSLPSLPAVALDVLRLAQEENASAADLATALERDPALAAKLIKLANSSLFCSGDETTVLRDAVVRLGVKTVKLMSLSFSLTAAQSQTSGQATLLGAYWRHSLTLATASRSLARTARFECDDEAFLCGLFADIGQLVLLDLVPNDYARVLSRADGLVPSLAAEEAELGLNRAHVTDVLIGNWHLPARLRRGAQWALGCETLPPPQDGIERKLHAAIGLGRLATDLLVNRGGAVALQGLLHEARRHGVGESAVNDVLLRLENELQEMASLFQLALPPGRDHNSIVEEARRQMVSVSLGAVAELHRERNRSEALASANRELSAAASTDGLTRIANRAAFDRVLEEQLSRRTRGGLEKSLGLVMVDVDHFKRFNDTYGHASGDKVLRMVAQVLKRGLRPNDLAARYGGEEFAIVYPEIGAEELRAAAERLRAALEAQVFELDGEVAQVTASFGCAHLTRVEPGADTGAIGSVLCAAADKALYAAKQGGRNRVAAAPQPIDTAPVSPSAPSGTAKRAGPRR